VTIRNWTSSSAFVSEELKKNRLPSVITSKDAEKITKQENIGVNIQKRRWNRIGHVPRRKENDANDMDA